MHTAKKSTCLAYGARVYLNHLEDPAFRRIYCERLDNDEIKRPTRVVYNYLRQPAGTH